MVKILFQYMVVLLNTMLVLLPNYGSTKYHGLDVKSYSGKFLAPKFGETFHQIFKSGGRPRSAIPVSQLVPLRWSCLSKMSLLQTEDYSGAIHVGTHMDAPCHIVEGQWTLEQIPLSRFMAPAAVVDITDRTNNDKDANLEVEDLLEWEKKTEKSLDGTIVLVNSGWGEKWNNEKDFLGSDTPTNTSTLHFPGVSAKAAEWVSKNRKIYGLGIDTTSLDNGQAVHRKAHQALFRANIFGLENVANLHMMPATGAFLFVFPMRIKEACGSPTRIIALLPKGK